MRRAAALLLLLLGVAAAKGPDEEWVFSFENGDRLRGGIAGIRNGSVLIAVEASPRAVAVPLGEISTAVPVPVDPDEPAPRPAAQILRLRDGAPLLGRCRAIRQGKIEFEVESIGRVTVQGRDVAELLPAEDAVRAYCRAMSPSNLDTSLPPERFDALWTYLGRPDANVALEAHRELVRAGAGAVEELGVRLRIQPDAPEVIAGWIAALDADSTEVRLLAHARLRDLGEAAAPQLKAAAQQSMSAEARRRIAALLADLAAPGTPRDPDPELLRFFRAIRVLEEIGTEEAKEVLGRLANGAPGTPTAREAQAALERLRRVR